MTSFFRQVSKNYRIQSPSKILDQNLLQILVGTHSYVIALANKEHFTYLACLHVQESSGGFGGPAFIQPIRAIQNVFKKL